MLRGIYSGAAAMSVIQEKIDIISNNMTKVDTSGYKSDYAVEKSFHEQLINLMDTGKKTDPVRPIGTSCQGVVIDKVHTDFKQGNLKETGENTDLALDGEGFFTVETPEGTFYTRNSTFAVDREGYLVMAEGHTLLGEAGPVQVGLDGDFTVDKNGVIYVNGEEIDRLLITAFDDPHRLEKVGDSYFAETPAAQGYPAEEYTVRQGFIELSNVDLLEEMVNIVTITRAYESNQKIIQAQDELLGKVINSVGMVK